MIYQVLEWTCTVTALAALVYRLVTMPRGNVDPALVGLTVYFFGSFLSFAVGLDAVSPYIIDLFGTQNITIILSHSAVIVLTAAQQVVLIYWANPPERARPKARQRIVAFGVVLAVLVIMFFLILPSRRHGTSETSSLLNMHNPYYAAYLILFVTASAVGQIITLRMSWTYSKIAGRAWLRRSMWAVVVGAGLILVYCVLRFAQVLGEQAGINMKPWNPVQWLAGDVGSLLELLGWTAAGWGPLFSAASLWIANYLRHQRLRPLWVALYRATPDIALDAPWSRVADLLLVRDLNYRLYRRVIEILDGQRALRPYLDPAIADAAAQQARRAGMTGDRLGPALEAIQLHLALRAKAEGGSPFTDPVPVVPHDPGGDLPDETKRLAALAKTFRRCAGMADAVMAQARQVPSG
jgi:hypothetical protein